MFPNKLGIATTTQRKIFLFVPKWVFIGAHSLAKGKYELEVD